uniref:mannosyl-oligosaccharide 1,3-1,6-alpha-mannosidase n=1 Tax=Astatotilapia calliptera TaxID=8154 RepID=A0AAX7U170_ASTCA
MKRSRMLAVLVGGIFCVAVMSLYRMLDLMQGSESKRYGEPPGGQVDEDLAHLQQKIDGLERLLSDNNRLVAMLRDTLLQSKASAWKRANNSIDSALGRRGEALPGCRLAKEMKDGVDGVQLLDVYDLLPFDNPDGGPWKQGFEITYKGDEWSEQPLELFLIPHSHNDPGWIKTFDAYYHDQTRHILDNMVVKLSEDNRYLIWAEISYFSKWWNDIDDQKRAAVKRLVEAGQLELVTGGWVMPDEANSHYFAMLDQLMEGHQWLQKHLGVKPRSGWAIDPFGHSPSMAYLLKGAGLHNMLIQRVHYSIKKHFAQQQTLEFLWRQSWDSSSRSDITCHMMPFYSYDVPHTCGPNPAVCCQFDFQRLPGRRTFCPWKIPPKPITDQNVHERALLLLDQYRQKSRLFRSSVLLVPLGDDFRYVESSEWDVQFNNYQKLFDYFNQHPELHIKARFGTLSDYFQALHRRLSTTRTTLPKLRGDFFSYADRDDHYWTGYFTSRPFYKRLDRKLEATLRATEILFSLTLAEMRRSHSDGRLAENFPAREYFQWLTTGRRNLALFQHHDAVAGTEREHVVVDYGTRLFQSILNLHQVLQSSAHWLLLLDKSQYHHDQSNILLTCFYFEIQKLRLQSGLVRKIQVQFLWYGTRTGSRDKSGAYLFLPADEGAQLYISSEPPLVRISRGPIFSDITSHFPHFTHTVRLFHLDGHAGKSLEISNLVDIRSQVNRELVMKIVSDVASGNRFYSDLNGFQMQQRRTLAKLPLQANFYPMTSAVFLQDSTSRLSLLSAQSQGVASLKPGELELVLDRRLQQDDNRGLGQGVTDNKLTASLYHLLLEDRASVDHLSLLAHLASLSLCHPPMTMVATSNSQLLKLRPFQPLHSSLPCDIHLLNLRTLEDTQVRDEADTPSQETALFLHRKGFDCSTAPEPAPQCTWSEHEEVMTRSPFI